MTACMYVYNEKNIFLHLRRRYVKKEVVSALNRYEYYILQVCVYVVFWLGKEVRTYSQVVCVPLGMARGLKRSKEEPDQTELNLGIRYTVLWLQVG